MQRANWVPAPNYFELNQACLILAEAFGYNFYLVGSSLLKRDFRDVDVRGILPDDEWDALFGQHSNASVNARLSVLNASISLWLRSHSDLPIDFQFQRQSEANTEFPRADGHRRHALGIFLNPRPAENVGRALVAESEASSQDTEIKG